MRFWRSPARRARCCTTTCAPWCWSGTAMVAVDTAFIPAVSTSPAIAASGCGCVRHIGRRPRARACPGAGRVERFIRYPRHSFDVPLASRLAQEGLIVDRETANLAAGRWLRAVTAPGPARHHWRHPGRAAGDRANAVAAGADTLTAAAACARCKARSRCRSSACSDRIDTLEPQLSATAGLFPRLGEVDGVRRAEPHLPQLVVVLEPENPAFRASRTHLEKQPAAVAKVARCLVRSTASVVNFPIVRATATRYNPSLYPS